MAILKFGAGIADMRGKQNGVVYSRNQYGAYGRQKVSPVNPQTPRQTTVRARVAMLSQYWGGTLTQQQRDAWIAAGDVYTVRSVYGETQTLNGIALFQRLNLNILNAGGAIIQVPPVNLEVPQLINPVLTAETDTANVISLAFAGGPLTGTNKAYIFVSPPMPPGRSFVKSAMRYLEFQAGTTTPLNIAAAYESLFGTITGKEGMKIFVLLAVVNTATGAVSPGVLTYSFIEAAP